MKESHYFSPPVRRRLSFVPGITNLIAEHAQWLTGRRLALLTHPAAVDASGTPTPHVLRRVPRTQVHVFFGPEHGFFGGAAAGENVDHLRHPFWGIPVYSLYGENRRPTPDMLRRVDCIVVDLQDLGVRCYTYVSTLRFILEAAATCDKTVVVADRPIPLPRVIDGPIPEPGFTSFIAAIPAPFVYGMTPGETALWLKRHLNLQVQLRVARMRGYARDNFRQADWPPWIPPSPGIASWESALCYPATVFTEAFPEIERGRAAGLPFQVLGAPWIRGRELCEWLDQHKLPGVVFHPHLYRTGAGETSRLLEGIRLTVVDPARFSPVTTSLFIVDALARLYKPARLWRNPTARLDFFDRLYGTAAVRLALLDGESPQAIAARWEQARENKLFRASRQAALLYQAQ